VRGTHSWIDQDGGGTISVVEFANAIKRGPKCELRSNHGVMLRLFQALDEDGSGELEEEEVGCVWIPSKGAAFASPLVDSLCAQFVEAVGRCKDPVLEGWITAMLGMMGMGQSLDAVTEE